MDFISVVKGLEEGKVFRRESWREHHWNNRMRLIKDEYGVLKQISFYHVWDYHVTDQDVLATDWVETEKEKYYIKNVFVENGIQYFTIALMGHSSIEETFRRFDFKQMMYYLDISFEDKHKEEIEKLMNPAISPFDYDFKKCAICGSETIYDHDRGIVETCPNGCLEYDIDPQGESALITLFQSEFDEEHFIVNLYEEGWHKDDRKLIVELSKFQEATLYWRENERYKERTK